MSVFWRAPSLPPWLERIWYAPDPPPTWLRPFAGAYGAVARSRRQRQTARAQRLPVAVIVVGNIAIGGTGKTPFVIWLVDRLRAQGFRPGVVSRGYGGRGAAGALRVTAGSDPAVVGDEPALIAQRLGCPVAVCPDRRAAAALLLADGGIDILVADDGLQHYALPRDLEIAVVDGTRGLGNGWLLPAGPLREPPERLRQVDLVVVNGGGSGILPPAALPPSMAVGGWHGAPQPLIEMHLSAEVAKALRSGEEMRLASFAGETVHAVAGIGNPGRFFEQLRARGLHVIPHPFPDHHAFTAADLDFGDGRPLLMTEKDAVKCRRFARPGWWVVPVTAAIAGADAAAVQQLLDRLRTR